MTTQQYFIQVNMNADAYSKMQDIVELLNTDTTPKKHTDLIVDNMAVATSVFSNAYFVEPLRRVGTDEKTIQTIEKAANSALKIQSSMLKKAFDRFSSEQLAHIAKVIDVRSPIQYNDDYFLKIPVETTLFHQSQELVNLIRTQNGLPKKDIPLLVASANNALHAITDYNFLEPLVEMGAKSYFIQIVKWGRKLWLAMNAHETKKVFSKLSPEQHVIYADLIEKRIFDGHFS